MSIWRRIKSRIEAYGAEAREACQEAFVELQRLERAQVVAAVKGDGFRSIYQRPSDKG